MIQALVEKTSLAGGEISKTLHARQNLAKFQTGVARQENMVTLVEGVATRRPGSRFQLPLKTQSERGKQWSFRFSAGDSYVLVFNGGKMRVKRDGGFVLDGSNPYEVDIPWASADLPNLRAAQVGKVLFVVCKGYEPRTITRNDHDDWVVALYQPTNGPVGDQNLDTTKTMQASAQAGLISLTNGFGYFQAEHVGACFRLDEVSLTFVPLWTASEAVSLPYTNISYTGSSNIGDMTGGSGLTGAFDGNAVTYANKAILTGVPGYVGKTFASPTKIARAQVTMAAAPWAIVVELRAKIGAAPANASDGDLLAQITVTNVSSFDLVSNNALTDYDHVWVKVQHNNFTSGGATFSFNCNLTEIVFQNFSGGSAVFRRWQGRIYQAITGGNSGSNPPTHEEGDVLSGNGGVSWRFSSRDYGFVRITAVTDGNNATGEVLMQLPQSIAQRETYRWWPPAWTASEGFPDRIYLHDGRLLFTRGNRMWLTRPSDLFSLEEIVGNPDSALAFALRAHDGSLPDIEWVVSNGGALVLGLRDSEWIGRTASQYEAITVDNFIPRPKKSEGSTAHVPALVEGGAIIIGRDRRRLHFVEFDDDTSALDVEEITKAARHILSGRAAGVAFQRDPNRVGWIWCENGDLRGLTFDPKEKVLALHRHPMTNGFVEDIVTVPSADESVVEVHLIVRRTIDGETCRYSEILTNFFEPLDEDNPTAEGAWFVDCGLRYQGAPATVISGLDHLEGQTVAVHADGATRPQQVVAGGQITLKSAASDVIVGLPIAYRIRSLPFDLNAAKGSTKGDQKRVRFAVVDLVDSAGGNIRVNGGTPEPMHRTGGKAKGAPIALRSGSRVFGPLDCPAAPEAVIEIFGDDTMPMTIAGFSPDLEVLED